MFNFKKFISVSAVAVLGMTNLLVPLSYADAATGYDSLTKSDLKNSALRFIMPDHNVYLYAVTEANHYFVDYHGNTGSLGTMPTSEYIYDKEGELSGLAFTKTGYTFREWNRDENGHSTGYANKAKVLNWTTEESGHVHIYAQWSNNRYNITYDLNDREGTSSGSHPRIPTSGLYDEELTIQNPSRTGYGFSGWDITNMDSESHIVGGQSSNATGATGVKGTAFKNLNATDGQTVHFAAKWTRNTNTEYKVQHFLETLNDGVYPDDPKETDEERGTTDTNVTPPVHHYTGFYDATGYTDNINANGTTVFRYEYPRRSYNLTLKAGRGVSSVRGSGTVTSEVSDNDTAVISFKYDEPVTLNFTLKSGYTGGTWSGYLEDDSTFNMPAFSTGKTAYATPIVYTIRYTYSGGTPQNNPTSYTVETPDFELNRPSRIHSNFDGWIGSNGNTPKTTVEIFEGSTGDRYYIAKWTCHVGFHDNVDYTECIANTQTNYTVRHWQESLTGQLVHVERDDETLKGTTLSGTNAQPKDYPGFKARLPIAQGIITGDGSTTVDVEYTRLSYTGTIVDTTGITGASADGQYSHGPFKYQDTVTLNADTEPGYTFTYWTVTDANNTPVTVTNSGNKHGATFNMPASAVAITPHVSVNTYNITMILHNGTGTYERTYTVESPDISLEEPTRDVGSVFDGWSGTAITSAPQKNVTIAHGSVGDRTYEAIWSCRAGYHAEGDSCVANSYTVRIDYKDGGNGGGTRTEDVPFVYDTTGTIHNPQQSGYDFAGWIVTGLSGGNARVDGNPITNNSITSGTKFNNLTTERNGIVTLTAKWTAKDDTHYEVHHYFKDLTGSAYTESGVDNLIGTTDELLTLEALAGTYEGFKYSSGYLNGGTTRPSEGAVLTTRIDKYGNTKIYLYYDRKERNVYLSGDANAYDFSGAGPYKYGATVDVSVKVKTGYHFVRWKRMTDNTFTTEIQ